MQPAGDNGASDAWSGRPRWKFATAGQISVTRAALLASKGARFGYARGFLKVCATRRQAGGRERRLGSDRRSLRDGGRDAEPREQVRRSSAIHRTLVRLDFWNRPRRFQSSIPFGRTRCEKALVTRWDRT